MAEEDGVILFYIRQTPAGRLRAGVHPELATWPLETRRAFMDEVISLLIDKRDELVALPDPEGH